MSSEFLKVGDVIHLASRHRVYADVPEHFVFSNKAGSWTLVHGCIRLDNHQYLYGQYVVERTTRDGGGSAFDGDFPSGHHVWCTRVDPPDGKQLDFYQSGFFTAMIRPDEIQPIAHATRTSTWTVID